MVGTIVMYVLAPLFFFYNNIDTLRSAQATYIPLSNDLLEAIIKNKFPESSGYFDKAGKYIGAIGTTTESDDTGKFIQYVQLSQFESNLPKNTQAYILRADCYKVTENKEISFLGQFRAKKDERITNLNLNEKNCQPLP